MDLPFEFTENENAKELLFPKEFEKAEALLISEVFMLLDIRRKQLEQEEEVNEMSDVFLRCHSYAQRMSRYRSNEVIQSIRQTLSAKDFHPYEVIQLANLCPDTSEEAKSLIPSLEGKISDAELDDLLADIRLKRSFQ